MSTVTRRWALSILVVTGLALSGLAMLEPSRGAAAPNQPHVVKLFEGGKVVAQWTSEDEGHMDGDSFVFTLRKGVSSGTVRLHGTFTVEPTL